LSSSAPGPAISPAHSWAACADVRAVDDPRLERTDELAGLVQRGLGVDEDFRTDKATSSTSCMVGRKLPIRST